MTTFQDWASIFIVFFRIIWPLLLSACAGLYIVEETEGESTGSKSTPAQAFGAGDAGDRFLG